MRSIYNKADNATIISRIEKLKPGTQNVWGKMTVDQMLNHCTAAINVAYGEQELKINFLMKLFGKMMKDKILNSEFKKNSPTIAEFRFNGQYDFDSSKKELIDKFSRFKDGHTVIAVNTHPFWGSMSYEDWDKLLWKHMDHHLRQFGV
ncbi:MAG: DUF1569 domain-containing protein [Flavobacterium sp.]